MQPDSVDFYDPAFRAKLRNGDPAALAAVGVESADGEMPEVKVLTNQSDARYLVIDPDPHMLSEEDLLQVSAAGYINWHSNGINLNGADYLDHSHDHYSRPSTGHHG